MNDIAISYDLIYKDKCKYLKNIGLTNKELDNYENFKEEFTEEDFKIIMNEKHRRSNKRYRTRDKFKMILALNKSIDYKGTIVFITIDPNDELLNQEYFIRKINQWLKQHFLISIVNKDYGDETHREHYHALALTTQPIEQLFHEDGKPKKSKTGMDLYELKKKDFQKITKCKDRQFEPTLCKVNLIENDINKTVNYLLKLNNHSNKETTKKERVRVLKSPLMRLVELRVE